MSNIEELKDRVESYVEEKRGVSFVEIEGLLEDDIELRGEWALTHPEDPKVNFWVKMSEEFKTIIQDLRNENRVDINPCRPFIYIVDGSVPDIDIAKRPPADGYKTERWLPATLEPPANPTE